LKSIGGVRLLKNPFYEKVKQLELSGATPDQFRELLGKGRAKKGIFEGDLVDGELEIGQIAAIINKVEPVNDIMERLISEFNEVRRQLCSL